MKISRFAGQVIFFCLAVIAIFVLSGYSHIIEIQDRLLCHALGIDVSGDEYEVTVQAFKPSGAGSDTPVDITKSNIEIVTGKGKTVSQALQDCENKRGKDIFLGHLQLISLGKSVDLSDPRRLFEFCLKDRTVYLGVDICMSDTSARELMEVELSNDMLATENYIAVIEKNAEKSRTVRCRLLDLLNSLDGRMNIAMPVLKVVQPDEEQKELSEPMLKIARTALIKDGKLLDMSLDSDNSNAFCLLRDCCDEIDLLIDYDGEKLSLRISKSRSLATVEQGAGALLYKVHLTVVVHRLKDIVNDYDTSKVEEIVKQRLTEQFDDTFKNCINHEKIDVFGIWKLLRQKYPKTYLEYEDRLDELYQTAQGEIEVECLVD